MKLLLFSMALLTGLVGCSSGPSSTVNPNAPAWVSQPTRTVDNGYIVYVGTSQDSRADRAQTMAEMAAVEDLANECSFVPKGSRTEDRYTQNLDSGYKAYAKVAIEFQDCEKAKGTVDPAKIRKLANDRLTAQLAQYQKLELAENDGEAADDVSTGSPPSGTSGPGAGGGGVRYVSAPASTTEFFVLRQQVAYQKEVVILSPPATYAPGTPQATQFASNVAPATTQIASYEKANPVMRSSPQTWSSLPERPAVAPPQGMRRAASASQPGSGRQNWRQNRQGQKGQQPPRGKQRRRRRHER